jgi:uncharacterized protein YqgC (DUF456 family)
MLFAAVAIAMLIGMVGVVAPFVPGLIIIWLAALAYGVFGDFGGVGAVSLAIITMLLLIGEALGYFLPGRAAGKAGAPAGSIAIGALGAIVGFFVIPVFGFMLGGILAIFLAELARTSNSSQAWHATLSTLIGFGVGVLAQWACGLAMIITWIVWVVVN